VAKNDTVLIDGIIAERISKKIPSDKRDEVFEYFVFDQILKNYDLTEDEVRSGWVDGRNDGGIDGFYIFVNGVLLRETGLPAWPRSGAELEIYVINCKHHDTFEQAPLNLLIASLTEILDFSIDSTAISDRYNEDLLSGRERLITAYRKVATSNPSIYFKVIYASRGDEGAVADVIQSRSDQVINLIKQNFSSSSAQFLFIGSAKLVELYRVAKQFSLDLRFREHLSGEGGSYVCLVPIDVYRDFVSDDQGAIRRYLFDSNVRDYLGENQVNLDIASSLKDHSSPDFWWLNNGVTILASAASVTGKSLKMDDVQIVNGLQTTESIHKYFRVPGSEAKGRCVLVRVLVSGDPVVQDRIIRATNNQSVIESAALRATEKTQRDIEDILFRHEWYYERRKNYHRNIGQPQARFVEPLYLASAAVSMLLKDPVRGSRLKSKFMRMDESYAKVFSPDFPIICWVKIVEVYKFSERIMALISGTSARQVNKWRSLVAFLFCAGKFKTFLYRERDIAELVIEEEADKDSISEIWSTIHGRLIGGFSKKSADRIHKDVTFYSSIIEKFAQTRGIMDYKVFMQHIRKRRDRAADDLADIDDKTIDLVDAHLGDQPWPKGNQYVVSKKIGISPHIVMAATQMLIERKRRYRQKNGIVFNEDGTVRDYDKARITPEQIVNVAVGKTELSPKNQ
jgi:hypothetical protein